jgi:Uma2 family endonuclease
MNLSDTLSFVEPIIEPEILESIAALPTEEDLPCDDGEPMETSRHREQMSLLIDSLKRYWSQRTDYYVGGNMFVYYDLRNRKRFRGPDFFLVLDVEDRERKSWVVWQEEMRFPDVIIELLSDSTRDVDKGEKKILYERVFRTKEYYLYDPFSHEFVGYRLPGVRYEESTPDAQGRIYSPATGLFLAVRNEQLRWLTPEGEVVPSPMELADQEQQRANQEQQRADQERHRAEQEQQRADHEQQRADHEQQRAERAEQLLESYQRRFGKLD